MALVKVLLVDDVKLFLELERTFFERTGCQILTASRGDEAISIALAERPDIILLDYELPGRRGDEVCRVLQQDPTTRNIPILMVTSHDSSEVRRRCLDAGAVGFVGKPISGRELLDRVVELLEIPHRAFMRRPLGLEIFLEAAGIKRRVEGFSEDVSETGILVEAAEYIGRGTRVTVELKLPGMERAATLEGEVRRTFEKSTPGRYGVGVQFVRVPAEVREHIRRYVEEPRKR